MTIEELLCIPNFSYITVINEHADLSRSIKSSDISETPDIQNFLEKDALLITTGMAFRDDPAGFCRLIGELNRLPAAGIIIKIGRFMDVLDPSVIETADRLGFPLLRIPMNMTLGMVCHQILSCIWDAEAEKLNYALRIQKEFFKMIIQNAPLPSLVRHLSKFLKNPVFLVNPFMEIIASSTRKKDSADDISKAHSIIRENPDFRQKNVNETAFSIESSGHGTSLACVFPVKVTAYNPYLLVVMNTDRIPYPYSQLVIEQVTTILAFTIYKNRALEENTWRLGEGFFKKFIRTNENKDRLSEALSLYGDDYGIMKSRYYQVIIAGIDHFESLTMAAQMDICSIAYEWLSSRVKLYFKHGLLFPLAQRGCFAILIQEKNSDTVTPLKHISTGLKEFFPISISFALGNEVMETSLIWFSYIEAKKNYDKCRKDKQEAFIESYASTGVQDLIQFIPDEHARHFSIYILKELAYPTEQSHIELRKTLHTYLDCQCDITKTAKVSYLHRNTIKYRIDKLNTLLGRPLGDPGYSLQLRMALLLSE